ncbi:MAG: hypothetical protein EON59_07875 [Alphaproteobacteria bacterium]|nr:MAG: hypothetical protein EON59_07875 [Alphaproteobacteria bacterium]
MILHPSFVLSVVPGETPVGYASRVAFGLGISLRVFCSRTDIPLQKLFEGEAETIGTLRTVCQLPQDTFADTTFIATPGRRLMLAGQTLSIDQVNREALRVCPACIREQLSEGRGFHEIWSPREWSITPLHVCNIHAVPIVGITDVGGRSHRQDFAGRLREASIQGLLPSSTMESVPESGLGQHIRQRLLGVDVDHWLSRLPLYASIKTAYMIGSAAVHGVGQAWVDLSPAERFEVGRVGHDILNEGEAGLRGLFTEFQRSSFFEANTSGLLNTFGRIYVSMSQGDDSAFDPLADVLRRHIIDTMPFGPGDVVLGQEVTERRLHSARTVAPELGVPS